MNSRTSQSRPTLAELEQALFDADDRVDRLTDLLVKARRVVRSDYLAFDRRVRERREEALVLARRDADRAREVYTLAVLEERPSERDDLDRLRDALDNVLDRPEILSVLTGLERRALAGLSKIISRIADGLTKEEQR